MKNLRAAGVSHRRRALKGGRRPPRSPGRFSCLVSGCGLRSSSPAPRSVEQRDAT